MQYLPDQIGSFCRLVRQRLFNQPPGPFVFTTNGDLHRISAVLFLMGQDPVSGETTIIFNKRSQRVRQPGDLCCPGGGISPFADTLFTRLLQLPASPLTKWPEKRWWRRHRQRDFRKLALLLATGLREGFEEMRLNPLGVTFLGPLPVQHLVMFKRSIYPLAGWVNRQQRFFPNWEVERIVRIPLKDFFNPGRYARHRLSFSPVVNETNGPEALEMPCFIHREGEMEELLWGATFRITMQFLETVAGFVPPALDALPVIHQSLGARYLEGSRLTRASSADG